MGIAQTLTPLIASDEKCEWLDYLVAGGLIGGDILLGGPTGEGIGPAIAILGVKKAANSATKEVIKAAREAAQKRGRELLKKAKESDCGACAGRSGGHGTPYKRAGAELQREASKLAKDDPLKEAMRTEAERLINQGKGHNHKM